MTYDCMTPDELELWRRETHPKIDAKSPCVDCPLWFAKDAQERGCCNGRPGQPRWHGEVFLRNGRGRKYPTDDARLEARRSSWRESKRRQRLGYSPVRLGGVQL